MRIVLPLFAVGLASASMAISAPAAAQSNGVFQLREECQPLTTENLDRCCSARNATRILNRKQLDLCPPGTTAAISEPTFRPNDDDPTRTTRTPPTKTPPTPKTPKKERREAPRTSDPDYSR